VTGHDPAGTGFRSVVDTTCIETRLVRSPGRLSIRVIPMWWLGRAMAHAPRMRLQTKLVGGFCLVAVVTLLVSAIGYWQARNLATALYEIGAVRLPSIQGLDAMREGLSALRAAEWTLVLPELDEVSAAAVVATCEQARAQVDRGRALYEPLPQTPDEAEQWRAFLGAWELWRTDHEAVVALVAASHRQRDPGLLAFARERSRTNSVARAEAATDHLHAIIAINEGIVADAQRRSVASRDDLRAVQRIMLGSACAGVAGAILLGLIVGRRLTQPVTQMRAALADVAAGDLSVHVPARSHDELGQMAAAMNDMVEAMRTSEARLRVLSDNLPDTMVYQVVQEPDGRMRFLHVSAGISRLHGLLAGAVLRDPSLLYGQVLPEDRPAIAAAEAQSRRNLRPFDVVVRIRRDDGAVRWMHICSQPRPLPDGRVIWDGFETDITESRRVHEVLRANEALLRQFVRHTPAAVAMFDRDMRYMHASDRWLTDYKLTGQDIIGRSHYDVFPEIPERWKDVHRRVLAGAVERCDEDPFPRADGTTDWLRWVVQPWRDADGAVGGVIMFTQVITERKRAEQKITDQLAELRRWQQVTLDREDRIAQLKREINDLCARTGQPPRYAAVAPVAATGTNP